MRGSRAAAAVRSARRRGERGAVLVVVVITLLIVGILGAAMATLCATSTREHVMAGFTHDAFSLSESGARTVIARINNMLYDRTNPRSPDYVMAQFGTPTTTVDDETGERTITLDAPLDLSMSGTGRSCSVEVEYRESYNASKETTIGTFQLVSTASVNPGTALAASVRNAYEFETVEAPGPDTLFDWALWAGASGIETDGTPSGVDSVPDASYYDTKDKLGEDCIDPDTGLPSYTAPVVSTDSSATSVSLSTSTIYGNVTTPGTVSPVEQVEGTITTVGSIEGKEPVADLGNGRRITDGGHSLVYTVGAGNVLTITGGTLPIGTWRHDGPVVIDVPKGKPLTFSVDVTLYAGGAFSVSSQSTLEVPSTGHLVVIASGAMSFATGSTINPTGTADRAIFMGTAACTSVSVQGCPAFNGAIYAPCATMVIGGGSSILGSVCGESVALNGNSRITWDQSLSGISIPALTGRYHTGNTKRLRRLVVADI